MIEKSSPPNFIRRRYRLSKWLGRGSIGLVYRAQDEALDRPVVIKFLEEKRQVDIVIHGFLTY